MFRSDLVSVIAERGGADAFALGFLDAAAFFGAVEVDAHGGSLPAPRRDRSTATGDPLRPGERLALPPLWLAAGADGWSLLEEWAAACGRAMRARIPERTPIGWCSWYYYFTRVRETDVVDNLETLRRLRTRVRCDYVQVDDGYQRAIGDWLEPNAKFPHGMRWLAQRIRAAGFDAGIWLAPFLARPESRLMQARPEWFVRTAQRPPAPGLLESNVEPGPTGLRARYDARRGARLAARARADRCPAMGLPRSSSSTSSMRRRLPGVRADRGATRAQALRRGLEAIREGAGPDAFLLGCGCPLGTRDRDRRRHAHRRRRGAVLGQLDQPRPEPAAATASPPSTPCATS